MSFSALQSNASPDGERYRGWFIVTGLIAFSCAVPLLAVVYTAFFPDENIWPHLAATVLPRYLFTTLQLLVGVGTLATFFGLTSAWLIAHCHFPGKRFFSWALLLPFAVPAYVIAYVYTDLLEYSGPVQKFLRSAFTWHSPGDYWFPEIRSTGGATLMFALVLYPYVYLTCRAALLEQSENLVLASRSLGAGTFKTMFRVIIPVIRPSLAVGLALVLMETLNDYGTVSYFAVQSLTAGLYDTWQNLGNLGGAAQLASLMVAVAFLLLSLERFSRRRIKTYLSGTRKRPFHPRKLSPGIGLLAFGFCSSLVLLGFAVPAGLLSYYAVVYFTQSWTSEFITYASNSLFLSTVAALLLVMLGTLLAYAQRIAPVPFNRTMIRAASVGYAMPGAVLAIGVIIPLAAMDNAIDGFAETYFGYSTGLLFSGTTVAILYAYSARFLTVSVGSAESGLARITPSMDQAARTLGKGSLQTLWIIHLPLLRKSLLTAALIVFVDCMKELPATLLLRPFNFETLATYVYQYASDELLEQSALAALFIVVAGLLPVILLNKASTSQT
jgi:iron(III) transport system permease protein